MSPLDKAEPSALASEAKPLAKPLASAASPLRGAAAPLSVDSVVAIRRLPIGTRLYLVASLMGPQAPVARVVKEIRSRDMVVTIDDPAHAKYGSVSYMHLSGIRVEATEGGFRIFEKGSDRVCSEYVFEVAL